MRRSVLPMTLAAALVACGGDKTTAPPATTSTVSITPAEPSLSLAIGSTVSLSATARDAAGNVLAGRSVAWTSSRAEVATVDASTGLVRGMTQGLAVVRATIDQKSDEVLVAVTAPVTSVQVTGRRTTVGVSGNLQLTVTTRDANGVALTGRTVTWTSSDETKARVSTSGLVSGVGAGSVTITATSEGVTGTLVLTIADLPAPQITGVSPAILVPGVIATISGANFETNLADLDVAVAGLPATVTAATATELTIQIPGVIACQPTQNTTVSVTGVAGTATRAHPLRVARQRSVGVGEMLVLSGLDVRCNELPQSAARYAIAVINGSRVVSNVAPFEFRGLSGSAAAASVAAASAATQSSGPVSLRDVTPIGRGAAERSAELEILRAHQREHERLMQIDRAILGRVPGLRRQMRAARRAAAASNSRASAAASAAQAVPVPLTVGATATLKFRTGSTCAQFKNVEARVVYVGSRSVVLESKDAPLAGTMDDDYVRLGTEYDNVMHQVLLEKLGDPLAFDTATDNNQRIVMLFAKAVNDASAGLLGRVSGCDFFPPEVDAPTFASSNRAEIFYARVPTSTEVNYASIDTRVGLMRFLRATLIHEAKHIVSAASRFAAPEEARFIFDDNWLEEGTAEAAVEFYARATAYAGDATWRGNATYPNTVYCDFRPTDPACGEPSILMGEHAIRLYNYYRRPDGKSFFASTNEDNDVYGTGWFFVRWAADQYAADEAAFFKAIIRETQVSGLASIEARTGVGYAELHPQFMMALYADDHPEVAAPAGARYTVPSWNMRSMMAGLSAQFPTSRPEAVPLLVQSVGYGSFTSTVTSVVGGGAAYFDLAGAPPGPQLLELRAAGGAALSADTPLRIVILRVQ